MDNTEFRKSFKYLVPSAILVVLLTLAMPRTGKFEYNYRKGSQWNYETLVAPFNFPILKTQEQILFEKERQGSTYVPYFRLDERVFAGIESDLFQTFHGQEDIATVLVYNIKPCYETGVIPDGTTSIENSADENPEVILVQKDKRAGMIPREEIYTIDQVCELVRESLAGSSGYDMADSVIQAHHIYEILEPNLIFDKQTTELVHQESSDFISPTSGVFKAGDVIVTSGEIITADIEQILDSYKAEFQQTIGYDGPIYMLWLGNFLIAIILVSLTVVYIWFSRPDMLGRMNEFLFALLIVFVEAVTTFVCCNGKLPSNIVYLIPYPVFALYYMAFFRKKIVLPLYSLSLLPVLVFCQGGEYLYMIFLAGGFGAVLAFSRFNKGWRQFVTALCILLTTTIAYVSFQLLEGTAGAIDPLKILYLCLGALFVILSYPLVYLFEMVFNLISVSRLVDLADTNAPLLRLLAEKAPGTFQHCLAVMNMAEAAGRSIDANVPLLRAAALYHDIGKTENPQCFIENQTAGVDIHKDLTLKESAKMIIHHVEAGLTLAEKYNIPSIIRECIASHHGTSVTGYFYNKYLNDGGNPDDVAEFFYPGPNPRTKEQVIIMLCDSLEAASRSLTDYSPESVNGFVHNIHTAKYKEGLYAEADITMHELRILEKTLQNYIINMHHTRIAYPSRKLIK